jgi:hypothetical protein
VEDVVQGGGVGGGEGPDQPVHRLGHADDGRQRPAAPIPGNYGIAGWGTGLPHPAVQLSANFCAALPLQS